ncbi:MAG: aminomethyl-transferring glycine dehydrogenase [Verrucomicrobiota bacterium]
MSGLSSSDSLSSILEPADVFARRHLGSNPQEMAQMLAAVGYDSLEALTNAAVPAAIRLAEPLRLPPAQSEHAALDELRAMIGAGNRFFRSHIGMGYSDCITPPVIQRNVLCNPGWYTAYTPYQAEVSQGRLEALLNFQTMIVSLTGLDIANASLLDEGTAAAEAVAMCRALRKDAAANTLFVSSQCHPQTVAVVQTRAQALGIQVVVGDAEACDFAEKTFAVLLQVPGTDGTIAEPEALIAKAHAHGALAIVAADLLALTLIKPPGEMGADVAVGTTQRFGVPMGYGGPHAAYFATRDAFKRSMPGRLVGVSRDAQGNRALRLALGTREQHIRREKATSNICTAQVLLAVMASMYAVYHGPEGLTRIARRVRLFALALAAGLRKLGWEVARGPFFDTVRVNLGGPRAAELVALAQAREINLRVLDDATITIALDETTDSLADLFAVFNGGKDAGFDDNALAAEADAAFPESLARVSPFLTQAVFQSHHTETEMMRYLHRLETKDLSLTTSMISLGSCTMKLNAASEMFPLTWPLIAKLHPFAPAEQARGYAALFRQLETWLAEITGLAAVSLQPNAGAAGEYAGLLTIRAYHASRGEAHRDICLIPHSSHGTNPASAAMAGFKVVDIACNAAGEIDLADLRAKAELHKDHLAALMVTYPSTHGVFEETIREICQIVHAAGGQLYMDGANMNAQVGLTSPGRIGADVCHLNLHKTFAIPHGGGGPGVGPIAVAAHLAPFLPSHSVVPPGGAGRGGAVASAPWGSASVLVIPWMYLRMMGGEGLTRASQYAILNANYIARRLSAYYPVLYTGKNGLAAHECILDLRGLKDRTGIDVEDVAKRLIDYGFHAPTMSWPVPGTLMVEPTESESKEELDRFCDAMIAIHAEILAVESGALDRKENPLKHAPHTARAVANDAWARPYPREQAAFPSAWSREHKFWPAVGRVDNVFGDRNLACVLGGC